VTIVGPDRVRSGVTGLDELPFCLVVFERIGLANLAVDVDVFQLARANFDVGILEGVLLAAEEQVGLSIGVDVQVLLDRIEVVRPVIDPVAVPEGGLEMPGGLLQGDREEFVGIDRHAVVLDDCGGEEAAGREGVLQRVLDGVGFLDQVENRVPIFRFDEEAIPFEHQRVVAVGLDEVHVRDDVEVLDARFEPDVLPPVLQDVTEVAVALGVELRGDVEVVVVPFEVAVLAGVDVLDDVVVFAEQDRPAATEDVVEERLASVLVERLVGGLDGDVVGQVASEVGCPLALRGGERLVQPYGVLECLLVVGRVAHELFERERFARFERLLGAEKATRRSSDSDLLVVVDRFEPAVDKWLGD
jgi:hypothetical protein